MRVRLGEHLGEGACFQATGTDTRETCCYLSLVLCGLVVTSLGRWCKGKSESAKAINFISQISFVFLVSLLHNTVPEREMTSEALLSHPTGSSEN